MGVITGIFIIIICFGLVILSRSITTLIHELGHAIPALLFTKEEVVICLGSYNDISKSKMIRFGRLSKYFKLNILQWIIGLCNFKDPVSHRAHIIITLGGPLASLILGTFLLYLYNTIILTDLGKSIMTLFILSAIFDFFINIIPINKPLYLYDGSHTYNDGKQLVTLYNEKSLPPEFFIASQLIASKKNSEGVAILESLINKGIVNDVLNSKLIDGYIAIGEYDKAIDNMSKYSSLKKMKTEDNAKLAFIFLALGAPSKALNYYNMAIHYDYTNAFYLNGRGQAKEALEDYNGAAVDYNASIKYNEGYDSPYVNMARMLYKIGEKKEAKNLLLIALKINPKSANAHFYLGKYYDDKHKTQKAYDHFLKAEALGCKDHGLDFYLANLKSDLENKQ